MNNSPMISVVMPVFNAEKYLAQAIDSILNQTFQDFEFIIINDGSYDGSNEILRQYQRQDNRIKILDKKNGGISEALNDGILISNGKYIARMDADDISLPTRFEIQLNFMEANPDIGVCGTWIEKFGENYKNHILKYPTNDSFSKVKLLFSVSFAHPTVMMQSKIIKKHNLKYNNQYGIEDYKFWLDIAKFTKFASIPKVLLKYRHLESSYSKEQERNYEKIYFEYKRVLSDLLERLNLKNTEMENKLHFIVGRNTRIAQEDIDLKSLNIYLNKFINANKSKKIFNDRSLRWFLAKKFLIVVYFKIKKRDFSFLSAIFYKFFWLAPFILISNKNL
tara:strand:+ start:12974 stop:13978 length:1005 start_codon:yes stop_codon:yes gene_type:complete